MKNRNIIKKLLAMSLCVALVLSLAACSGKKNGGTYKIGICNYVDDASLNQIVENIQAQLKAIGAE